MFFKGTVPKNFLEGKTSYGGKQTLNNKLLDRHKN
jgi:hypothetical protein